MLSELENNYITKIIVLSDYENQEERVPFPNLQL
jgi:hypothetical protein